MTKPSFNGLATHSALAPDDVFARAKALLTLESDASSLDEHGRPSQGDHVLNPFLKPNEPGSKARPAAVLVGLVARSQEVNVILTTRASTLKVHSGQIAFPGGKIETVDKDPLAAALREAHEEIGLDSRHVEPIGYLDPYLTRTGFLIHPVVAKIVPPFALRIDAGEVEDAFEVPLSFLMNADHHQLHARTDDDGISRRFYAMLHGERLIWGATAGILRNLYERLYL